MYSSSELAVCAHISLSLSLYSSFALFTVSLSHPHECLSHRSFSHIPIYHSLPLSLFHSLSHSLFLSHTHEKTAHNNTHQQQQKQTKTNKYKQTKQNAQTKQTNKIKRFFFPLTRTRTAQAWRYVGLRAPHTSQQSTD